MAERNNMTAASPSLAPASSVSGAPEERSAEEIRQHIAATRESITDTVDRLSDRFQETFDWRTYVADYPLVAIGVATGLGFLVAGIFKRRSTPGERMMEALADNIEDLADRFRHQLDGVGASRPGLSRTVKAAATGAITQAVTNHLRNRITEYYWARTENVLEKEQEFQADRERRREEFAA